MSAFRSILTLRIRIFGQCLFFIDLQITMQAALSSVVLKLLSLLWRFIIFLWNANEVPFVKYLYFSLPSITF